MKQYSLRRIVLGLALGAGCVLAGTAIPTANQALGEVRGTPEQPQFQSGSVPLLREISTTLHQMDARLARLEVAAQKLQAAAKAKPQRTTEEENN